MLMHILCNNYADCYYYTESVILKLRIGEVPDNFLWRKEHINK